MGKNAVYDVYGIGNALVDIEVEVDPSFLEKQGVEKGIMTLIDENRQNELLKNLEGKSWKKSSGGSAANTIMGVSHLGGKTFYSCKVANDEFGDFFYQDLTAGGVDSNCSEGREKGTTGKCLVMITPDADRTLNPYLGITQTFSTKELREEQLKQSKYLYIEGYLLASPLGHQAALAAKKMALKHGVKISLTLSDPFIVKTFRKNVKELIGSGIDLIFCNEEEALQFGETQDFKSAIQALKQVSKQFVVTLGSKGSLIFDGKEEINIAPIKTVAKNTNGAGDMYAGAYLYGITNGLSPKKSGDLASMASAKVVSQFGPRPTKSELLEIKNQFLKS